MCCLSHFVGRSLTSLRYLEHKLELSNPEASKRIYMFNTFFYENLTNRGGGRRGVNYEAVAKWTSKIDLFGYDYVVVPINEKSVIPGPWSDREADTISAHWYLAIICNLGALTHQSQSTSTEGSATQINEGRATKKTESDAGHSTGNQNSTLSLKEVPAEVFTADHTDDEPWEGIIDSPPPSTGETPNRLIEEVDAGQRPGSKRPLVSEEVGSPTDNDLEESNGTSLQTSAVGTLVLSIQDIRSNGAKPDEQGRSSNPVGRARNSVNSGRKGRKKSTGPGPKKLDVDKYGYPV